MRKRKDFIGIVALLLSFLLVACGPAAVEDEPEKDSLKGETTQFHILYENPAMEHITMTIQINKSATEQEIDGKVREMIVSHVMDETGETLDAEDIVYSLVPLISPRDLLPDAEIPTPEQ